MPPKVNKVISLNSSRNDSRPSTSQSPSSSAEFDPEMSESASPALFATPAQGRFESHEKRPLLPASMSSGSFSILEHGLIIGLMAFGLITCLIIVFSWRSIRKRKRKAQQLAAILPKPGKHTGAISRPVNYGIRPDQSIEFVVPTITVPETTAFTVTEDSMSDSDFFGVTSGSDREGGGSGRRRHPAGRYVISPLDINRRLYLETEQHRKSAMGRVNFVLHYSFFRQQLLVTLLSACELPLSVKKGHVNPFAKVRLLPEKTPKFITKMQKRTTSPLFNELFIFSAKKATLDNRVLRISLWHYDRFSRKYFIGQTHYKLSEAGITSDIDGDVITDEIWCPLKGANQYSTTE